MSFPCTSSFVGEFLLLIGCFKTNISVTFLAAIGIILGAIYSLWLFNRIAYGNLKTQYIEKFIDISPREFISFFPLILGTLIAGVYPNIFLDSLHMSVNYLTELFYL
jgi:NADH:ubiquinone oxidoreductase subunit 4 (subunit M)